ncbi:Conserved_hypothetical protein [Hexamita inflata]|uniref:MSP domain-containing protein n=1 Tax=Hexamita inflata TaxID=28002 RepID=A0AA86PNY0_9EUKA|nr:Conserved hypothetical protein [Hexamita inflata]
MSFSISTDLIRFTQILETPVQTAELTIQNLSSKPQRVRVQKPKTNSFTIDFENLPTLAPGMKQKCTVTFKTQKNELELVDMLKVFSDEQSKEVRLEAYAKYSNIELSTEQIDFGVVCSGDNITKEFIVTNTGSDPADIFLEVSQISGNDSQLTLTPAHMTVAPKEKVNVRVAFTPVAAGAYQYQVKVTDIKRQNLLLQVVSSVMDPVLVLSDNDNHLVSELIFKSLFFSTHEQTLKLYNPTPFQLNFSFKTMLDTVESQSKAFSSFFDVSPQSGQISSKQTIPITITFQPKIELSRVDAFNRFVTEHTLEDFTAAVDQAKSDSFLRPECDNASVAADLVLNFNFKETHNQQQKKLIGFAKKPVFAFSITKFYFVDKLEQKQLQIKNLGAFSCNLEFKLPTSVHFFSATGPRTGSIRFQPKETQTIDVFYNPKARIELNDFIHIEFGNKWFNVNYPVFVNFDQTQKLLGTVTAKICSQETQKLITTESGLQVDKEIYEKTIKNQQHETYEQIKTKQVLQTQKLNYSKYLKRGDDEELDSDSESAEQDQKVTAYNDGLDLGLQDTAYAENKFNLKQQAKLIDFTQNQISQAEQCVETQQQPKERPALKNDLSPTVKQYTKQSFDPVLFSKIEQEVKNKLLQRQLVAITSGTTEYDFGEVTAQTEVTRYFKIANDLQQYIKIDLVKQETRTATFSIQETQYLPPSCYTSFQLTIKFMELSNKFNDKIQIKINDLYFGEIAIKAVIVRPKLQLNVKTYNQIQAQEVINKQLKNLQSGRSDPEFVNQLNSEVVFMELNGQNAFQQFILKDLYVQNIGTSAAELFFDFMQTAQDLSLNVKTKTIEIGDQTTVKLSWSPQQDEITSNILVISFQESYQPYYVPIICKLTPGKAQIQEKAIDLGTINVSKSVPAAVTLVNKSVQKPLYYELLVNSVQTELVTVNCDLPRGEIPPGESFQVSFSVEAKKIGSFNSKLQVKIVGGEVLSIPIKGVIEQPKLLIKPYSFAKEKELAESQKLLDNTTAHSTSRGGARSTTSNVDPLKLSQPCIKFEKQMHQIDDPLTAHAPSIQRFVVQNTGKVSADIFIDCRQAQQIEIMESELQEGVTSKQVTGNELMERIQQYSKVQATELKTERLNRQNSKKLLDSIKSTISLEKVQSQYDILANRFQVPIFKSALDIQYQEYNNFMMNGQNLNEQFGGMMIRAMDNPQKGEQNKLLFITIPTGKQFQLNLSITEDEGASNREAVISFFVLGVHSTNDVSSCQHIGSLKENQLSMRYRAVNSIIQASLSKINFGIKVADNQYKQNILSQPVHHKDIFATLSAQQQLPFMRYAANTGLFYQDFTLTSQQNSKVKFVLEVNDLNDQISSTQVFMTSHPFGILGPYDSVQIRIYYSPSSVGVHQNVIKIFYTDQNVTDEQFFLSEQYRQFYQLSIHAQSVAVHRCLTFTQSSFTLPNTFVGVPSRIQFFVYNVGYKNTTRLSVFFPPELSKTVLSVQFPWGNQVNHMIKMLPVVITFYSDVPISFLAQMSILDEDNVPYTFQLSGNCFDCPFNLQEYIRTNTERLETLDGKQTLKIKTDTRDVGQFPSINELKPILEDNEASRMIMQRYKVYGFTRSNIQALMSISAKPIMEISDYAKSIKLDAGYQDLKQLGPEFAYEIINIQQQEVVQKKKSNMNASMELSNSSFKRLPGLPIIQKMMQGPFATTQFQQYNQLPHKLRYFWQSQFKTQPSSESPISPLIMTLPDQVLFDEFDKNRLGVMLTLVNQIIGLKVNSSNFYTYCTAISNRTSPFLQWVLAQYKQNFLYSLKELQNIPAQDDQKCLFLKDGFESFSNCLKIKGAMINNINSALLLAKKDFVNYCRLIISKQAQVCFTKIGDTLKDLGLNSQLISQTSGQLLLEVVGIVHDQYHQSAWFHILVELSRLYVINFAAQKEYAEKTIRNHSVYAQNEGSEFELCRGVGGNYNAETSKVALKHYSSQNYIIDNNPENNLLCVINYFTNFQLQKYYDKYGFIKTTDFNQLLSGVQVACFIVSFVPNPQIIQRIEEVMTLATKIVDMKTQRSKETNLISVLNLTQRDADTGDKLFTQFDLCRFNLWREICTYIKTTFSLVLAENAFFQPQTISNFTILSSYAFNQKLILSYLYQLMPSYLPQKTIRLECSLNEQFVQTLEIVGNPRYSVKYQGSIVYPQANNSCEVQLNLNAFTVEPKQVQQLQLSIKPNFIKNCYASVQFAPIYDQNITALPQANYTGVYITVVDKSVHKEVQIEAKCGAVQKFNFQVENTTTLEAKYKVQIEEQFYAVDPLKPVKANVKPSRSLISFKTEKVIVIPPKQHRDMVVQFSPTHPGLYVGTVTLADDKVGQRSYEIKGFATLPDVQKQLKFVCQNTDPQLFQFGLAELELGQQATDGMKYALIPINHQNSLQMAYKDKFQVHFVPKPRFVPDQYLYKLVLIFEGMTKVYELILTILKRQEEQKIEFATTARVVQDNHIAVQNLEPTEIECLATVSCSEPGSFLFNYQKESEQKLKLAPKQTQQYTVRFQPHWVCDCTCKIIIKQIQTGIVIADYLLHGVATEPLCSGQLSLSGGILDEIQGNLPVKCDRDEFAAKLRLEDDNNVFKLVNKTVDITQNETTDIQIGAVSYTSGKYSAKLFIDMRDKTYYWYELFLTISPRECSGNVSEKTCVGEAKPITVKINNPLKDQYVAFQVNLDTLPAHFIQCAKTVSVAPRDNLDFTFQFKPLATGSWSGKIKFFSQIIGEYWYQLTLSCDEVKAESIQLEAPIGSGVEHIIPVVNNFDDMSLTFTIDLSNSEAFVTQPKRTFQVKPRESLDLKLVYRPTKVHEQELCTMNLIGKDTAGTVFIQSRYRLSGQGTLQKELPIIKIFAQLNQGTSGQIQFRNPFLTRASVTFVTDAAPEFTFQYKEMLMDPSQVINIKYFFVPKKLQIVQATLRIVVNPNFDIDNGEQFPFEYLFEGVGEYTHKQPLAYLECQSRQQIQKTVALPPEIQIEDIDTIKFEIECSIQATNPFEDTAAAVKKALSVQWLQDRTQSSKSKIAPPLPQIGRRNLLLQFAPLKSFACDVLLVLNQQEGGRYKLPLSLFAATPQPEGTITVELPNGSTPGEYIFQHCNILNVYSEFRAYFTPSSSERFSVSPQSGILEPSQQTGIATVQNGKATTFRIGCQTGTNNARGQLVIETKDIVFMWDVISGYKKYVPPVGNVRVK